MADFPDRSHWQALALQLSMPGQAFIDGRYVDAASGAVSTASARSTVAYWARSPTATRRKWSAR